MMFGTWASNSTPRRLTTAAGTAENHMPEEFEGNLKAGDIRSKQVVPGENKK